MVIKPVTSQAAISNAGLPTWRAMSADTMKIPEPIIEPATIIVASSGPRPFTNWPARLSCLVAPLCSGMGIRLPGKCDCVPQPIEICWENLWKCWRWYKESRKRPLWISAVKEQTCLFFLVNETVRCPGRSRAAMFFPELNCGFRPLIKSQRFIALDRYVGLRDQHIDRRHHKKGENRTNDHAADQHDTDAVSRSGAWAISQNQREVAADRGRRGHENGAQPGARGANDRLQFGETGFLQMVSEFDDQNSVFGNEADQSYQADLAIDIQSCEVQKRKHQRTRDRQRHRTREHDEGIAEALELRGQHQINQDCRQ